MQLTYAVPKVALPVRFLAFAGFGGLGIAIQVLVPGTAGIVLGTVGMIPGLVLVWARNYKNKPVDLNQEDWQPTSAAEFDRINTNLALTRLKRFSVLYRSGFGVFVFAVLLALTLISAWGDAPLIALFFFDAIVLLFPFLFSGNVVLWTPQELAFKMHGFQRIIQHEPTEGGDVIITPYLRLDKDKQGRRIPEDIRLMAEPRRKPADFLGVQLQVAVNKGPNGSVPYMYAVFLCKGKGATYQKLAAERFGDMVKEPGGDKEYGYIVVRQQTSGDGYHTTDADIDILYGIVKQKCLALKGA
jgi:hypothetical protein